MLSRTHVLASLLGALAIGSFSFGGIPVPDTILYGWVFNNHQLQVVDDDISVIAHLNKGNDCTGPIVGKYHLGDNAIAGDRYVIHIRLESLADGSKQSDSAALVGQTVQLCIQRGIEPEQHTASYEVSQQAHIEQLDLGNRLLGDEDYDAQITLSDYMEFTTCMQGPGASTTDQCLAIFDFDRDQDVDFNDYRLFRQVFTGK